MTRFEYERTLLFALAGIPLVSLAVSCPDTELGPAGTSGGAAGKGGGSSQGGGGSSTSPGAGAGGSTSSSGGAGGGALPSYCSNGHKDEDETDDDCGGPTCPACGEKRNCATGSDCESAYCPSGKCQRPPSCQGTEVGSNDCGENGSTDESCCTTLLVKGGTFKRTYDKNGYKDDSFPATVSDFRLDKYEVTIGRFRQFVTAWVGNWRPAEGGGKHAHLNGGLGLMDSYQSPTAYESGWDPDWETSIAGTKGDWDTALGCDEKSLWTADTSDQERHPTTCAKWSEAFAFCVWDGGFLPSEAEWNYAAAAGTEQREYPWSPAEPINCNHANGLLALSPEIDYCVGSTLEVGTLAPKGTGKFGQADLAGNVHEFTLDQHDDYKNPCVDCATLFQTAVLLRAMRGGSFTNASDRLRVAQRDFVDDTLRAGDVGFRCARSP